MPLLLRRALRLGRLWLIIAERAKLSSVELGVILFSLLHLLLVLLDHAAFNWADRRLGDTAIVSIFLWDGANISRRHDIVGGGDRGITVEAAFFIFTEDSIALYY